jgi:hypothetical protein
LRKRKKRKRTICAMDRGCGKTGRRDEKEENRKSVEDDKGKKMEEKIKRLHKRRRKR